MTWWCKMYIWTYARRDKEHIESIPQKRDRGYNNLYQWTVWDRMSTCYTNFEQNFTKGIDFVALGKVV